MKVFKSVYNGGGYGGGACIIAASSVEECEELVLKSEFYEYIGWDSLHNKNVIDYSEMTRFEEIENCSYEGQIPVVLVHDVYRE